MARASELTARRSQPRLAVVVATEDESSAWYVRSISGAAGKAGIACDVTRTHTVAGVAAALAQLADDPDVHGVVLQTPLPEGARLPELASVIPVAKDVDGASPESIDRLVAGLPAFAPATAEAVLALLERRHVAADVAAGRRVLDLDHRRAQVGQLQGAPRAGAELLDREDREVGQRRVHQYDRGRPSTCWPT